MRAFSELTFSPDGSTLAACLGDVHLWDVASRREKARLGGHSPSAFAVAFSPDGRTLASGGNDASVRLWDADTGQQIATFWDYAGAVGTVLFSPDGRILASASEDGTIVLWNMSPHITPLPVDSDFDGNGAVDFADFFTVCRAFRVEFWRCRVLYGL